MITNGWWQNTESREHRVYMSSSSPSQAQKRMTSFIIHIYVPTFLEMRYKNLLLEGPRHLLSIITRIQTNCTEDEIELLRPHIQFNGYFGQLEVVLASLLGSSNKEERKEGLDIIIKLRKKEKRSKRKTVRKVRIPNLYLMVLS